MKPAKYAAVVLLIFQFYFCFVECPQVHAEYRFDNWTTDDGLPQNGVRRIAQTPDGYLWFTTFDGLVRFDGVNFTTFNKSNTKGIINNRFTNIFADKDGNLYATTAEDGVLTVYRDGTFTTYNSEQVPGNYIKYIETDANGELRFLSEDEDRTSKTWYYLRDGKFVFSEKVLPKDEQKLVLKGKSGAMWTVTATETIERRDGKTTIYALKLGDFTRTSLYEDREGSLWIGETCVHRLHDGAIKTFAEKDGLPKNSIYHQFWEADNSVWFATGGYSTHGFGLIQYQNGQLIFRRNNKEEFTDASIGSTFQDREGTIWLATDKGLSRFRREVIRTLSVKDGLVNSEVYPILRDSRENVWVGTSEGLNLYRNGKFELIKFKALINAPQDYQRSGRLLVQSLFEDANGKIWMGVVGSIFIVENDSARMLEGTLGYQVFSIKSDRAGNVWAATNIGLLKFKDYKLEAKYTVKDGLPNEFMTSVFEDSKGRLWFGGMGGLTEYKDGKFINHTANTGLTGNYVRTIYEDGEGTLWIGTYDEGMSRLKDGAFFNYKAENGLSNNGVFAIQEDSRQNFWISSNRGIYRVKRQELNDFADKKIEKINSISYGKEDGMLSNECNGGRQPSSITDKDGNFWFATQNGVAIVNPQFENYNSLPPSVFIESVTVEREPVNIRSGLQIESGQKNIEIHFTGISLIRSNQTKFKYKLEGHDADWVDAGTRRTAHYSYLPPGTYKFLVKAANSDGVWNETGVSLSLEKQPFIYQMKWFYLVCIATGALLLFIVWKISVHQLETRERKLARLVSEKTRELQKVNDELRFIANSDGLTAISNRRLFEEFLAAEWSRAIRFKTEISVILLDIDHFKLFNDSYGHQAGDECLKKIAKALKAAIHRPTDLAARFGGEEFAVVLGGTDAEGAYNIAEQIAENIKQLNIQHRGSNTSDFVTASIGIATTFAVVGMDENDLIKAADEALYQAKASGRNRIISTRHTIKFSEASIFEPEMLGIN